jgi:hypothetical protein
MIDTFALAVSHGLILLTALRLVRRPDLDDDNIAPPDPDAPPPWLKQPFRHDA